MLASTGFVLVSEKLMGKEVPYLSEEKLAELEEALATLALMKVALLPRNPPRPEPLPPRPGWGLRGRYPLHGRKPRPLQDLDRSWNFLKEPRVPLVRSYTEGSGCPWSGWCPTPFPQDHYAEEIVQRFAASIERLGLLYPLLVYRSPAGEEAYVLVDGALPLPRPGSSWRKNPLRGGPPWYPSAPANGLGAGGSPHGGGDGRSLPPRAPHGPRPGSPPGLPGLFEQHLPRGDGGDPLRRSTRPRPRRTTPFSWPMRSP